MALILVIKVFPSSGKQGWATDKSGRLLCYIKSAPEHGKANAEVMLLCARAASIDRSLIKILLGTSSRNKTIKLDTLMTLNQFYAAVGVQVQHGLF
jgi:hypothetical protein